MAATALSTEYTRWASGNALLDAARPAKSCNHKRMCSSRVLLAVNQSCGIRDWLPRVLRQAMLARGEVNETSAMDFMHDHSPQEDSVSGCSTGSAKAIGNVILNERSW
jgi:hypothetical protein